jgi:hypothetical protein
MTRFSRYAHRIFLALVLVFPGALPVPAQAVSDAGEPLVIIRFNQQRVYFDQQLYSAISKAVVIKPEVTFEVVSYAPVTGNAVADKNWQAVAGHNTRAVITAMNGMGVPMDRIHVTGQSQQGLRYDETHVFVK